MSVIKMKTDMTKKVAILQSNYIPWKGYFDLINQVDEFILYDEMQFTKNDWRNRNRIVSAQGVQWLTIPVKQSGKSGQKICETQVAKSNWGKKHWQTLVTNYSKAPFFKTYQERFKELYLGGKELYLSEINFKFLTAINELLNITTKMTWSTDYQLLGDKSEKLVNICQQAGATDYYSGPAAKDYLDEILFAENKIKVHWMDYAHYPEYSQLHKDFEHGVSIIDLIFNLGPKANQYMKSFQSTELLRANG